MGFFLKRFFSLRHKQSKAASRTDQEDNRRPQPLTQPGNEEDWKWGFDEHAAFRSKRPKVGAKNRNPNADDHTDVDPDAETDAAVSRLLRSASANYKVVNEGEHPCLSHLPNPVDSVSSRSTSALSITPTPSGSLQTRGSYRVTVHKRQQLSATFFPNAYPPITPRRPGVAHTSTPNLLATATASNDMVDDPSSSTPALLDPRKVHITPRDASRLKCLRQDPSVVSLVRLYDDHGRIAENAFATTPAPRRRLRAKRNRRKSTFSELLGCDGADLQWAESCIAKQGEVASDNSISNASTSSLSSGCTPPLDSPATSTFNDTDLDRDVPTPAPALARDPSGSTVTGQEKNVGFSSLVVELSADSNSQSGPYLGPHRRFEESTREKEPSLADISRRRRRSSIATVDSRDRTMGSKILRKPSQRASQIFNFIPDRRERRKSQELLQGSTLLASDAGIDAVPSDKCAETATNDKAGSAGSAVPSRARSPSLLGLPGSSAENHPRSAPPHRLGFNVDPLPASSSQVTLRPEGQAPRVSSRSRSSTCSQATGAAMYRAATNASTCTLPSSRSAAGFPTMGRPLKGSTAALTILQLERERDKERKKEAVRAKLLEQESLPATSTPHPSRVARFKKVSFARRQHGGRSSERAAFGEVANGSAGSEGDYLESFERFAANLDARTQRLQSQSQTRLGQKENAARVATRRRGATIDLGLTRAATTTLASTPADKYARGEDREPQTPIRSQSLRLLEPGKCPSSEYAEQMMADLRAQRSRAEHGKHATNAI